MITIVEQSTRDRLHETEALFEKIKPFLDEGYNYRRALILIGRIGENTKLNNRNGWFRELTEYGGNHGYNYYDYRFNRTDKVGKERVKSYDWIHYRRRVL